MPGGPGDGRSYEFGTPYETMLNALASDVKNADFYRKTRLLDIIKRNKQIKLAPERWQDADFDVVRSYDVVVCFEQRIFDLVIEGTCLLNDMSMHFQVMSPFAPATVMCTYQGLMYLVLCVGGHVRPGL